MPPAALETAQALHEQAARLAGLVGNLLDMARLNAGNVTLRREWQPLEEVIGASIKLLGNALASHPVRVALPVDLPLLEFDAVLLERVFCNLLENAAKYSPDGARIEIAARALEDSVEISVCDHGTGFPDGSKGKLFAMFVRGDAASAKPGTGLGLAICRAIVEAHGGTIMPRTIARTAAPVSASPCRWACRPCWRRRAHDHPGPNVLLIEDEKQIRRFVRAAIEEEGCQVTEAETMAQGLIEAGLRKPDLLILDLGLPDGNGIDLIRDLRGWSDVPVLILSARSQENDKIAALDAGADDYLTKPFSVGELRARVRALLRRRARSGEAASPVIEFGDVAVDLSRRLVFRAGAEVHLTPIEYRLLSTLLGHPGKVLTQRNLLREIWGPSYVESSHYLRVYVGHLRQKLEVDPTQPQHFLTETGVGYRFQP